jgi:hypothetical protein
METFLAAVRATHGDAEGWARDAGLSDDVLVSLRAVLVTAGEGGSGTRMNRRAPALR